jgi:hypothetical protein
MRRSHSRSRPLPTIRSRAPNRMRERLSLSWLLLLQQTWFGGKSGERTRSLYVASRQYNSAFRVQATGFGLQTFCTGVASLFSALGFRRGTSSKSWLLLAHSSKAMAKRASAKIGPL